MSLSKVNVAEKLARIDSFWNPHIVGDVNDMQVKVVKFQGAFDWHHHVEEDELFFVLKGNLLMKLRTGNFETERTRHKLERI